MHFRDISSLYYIVECLLPSVQHGRNLIWAQNGVTKSGVSRIVSIDGDPDRWVPNRTATTRYITAPANDWLFTGLAFNFQKQNLYWSDTGTYISINKTYLLNLYAVDTYRNITS